MPKVSKKVRWSDLTPAQKRLIIAGASVDGAARVAALTDLARRPSEQVRGKKWLWALALGLFGSGGLVPFLYAKKGRR